MKAQDYSRFILGLEFFNREDSTNLWELIATQARTVPASERIAKERQIYSPKIVELMAFVLMPNHYHLIVREIKGGGIISFMRKMGGYSLYFNKQYDRVGPLFQSRYKSLLVKTDIQLNNLFVYVHTNPVELKEPEWKDFRVENKKNAINWLETYRWSSYLDYVGNLIFPVVTQREFFTELFGGEGGCRKAVEDWIDFKAQNSGIDTTDFE